VKINHFYYEVDILPPLTEDGYAVLDLPVSLGLEELPSMTGMPAVVPKIRTHARTHSKQ